MPQIEINDPLTGADKPQSFTVNGFSDAVGATVNCTISKGAFSQTNNGTVSASHAWSISLGAPPRPLIPSNTDYAITASVSSGGVATDDVDGINVMVAVPVSIDFVRFRTVDSMRNVNISGTVTMPAPFDTLLVLVHQFHHKKGNKVVASGWIQPVGANWAISLPAPNTGRLVVQALGIDTGGTNGGEVVNQVTRKK